jgi:hypothetical protein
MRLTPKGFRRFKSSRLRSIKKPKLRGAYAQIRYHCICNGSFLGRWYHSPRKLATKIVTALDSDAKKLFAIAGINTALLFNAPATVAIRLGVIITVGGGVLRDILARCSVHWPCSVCHGDFD